MRTSLSLLLLGLACGFTYMYYDQHLKWRACFNALGRCFDPESGTVHLQQSGLVWLLLALLSLAGGIFTLWRAPFRQVICPRATLAAPVANRPSCAEMRR